ncbi:MAG: hypothetical protein IPL97_10360 [Niastella sp.]|nr:hypothetical protein [Niastella sp.]
MNNPDTILISLKDFSIEPPASLYPGILQKIEQEETALTKKIVVLKDCSILPSQADKVFQDILMSVAGVHDTTNLQELKDYPIQPHKEIERKVIQKVISKEKASIIFILKRVTAVAAGLVIIFAIWKLLETKNPTAIPQSFANTKSVSNPAPSISDTFINITPAIKNPIVSNTKLTKAPLNKHTVSIVQVNGENIKIIDNDFIKSFASFTNNIPSFIYAPDNEKVSLRVDKTTSIEISSGMRSMMQKMYRTKRNGEPRSVAKKMKKRLLKWQQIDTQYFDNIPGKNPMDPLDLGNIIF